MWEATRESFNQFKVIHSTFQLISKANPVIHSGKDAQSLTMTAKTNITVLSHNLFFRSYLFNLDMIKWKKIHISWLVDNIRNSLINHKILIYTKPSTKC